MPPDSTFIRNLEKLKADSGKTWLEIGKGIGHKDDRYIYALKSGTYEPRQVTIRKLASFFEVPESYFSEEHE